jgi:hypothetical protein
MGKPYDPDDPLFEKVLAVLLVPVWRVVGWVNNLVGRRP